MFIKYLWFFKTQVSRFRFKKIGKKSYIAKPIFLLGTKKIIIGDKVRIYPGARMEVHGHSGEIEIMSNTSIGQNFHITSKDIRLTIGENTTILGNVFITNIDHDYREIDKHIMQQQYIITETQIGKNCFIGYGAAIQAGTILGKQCIVGTNSVVKGVFPDYSVIVGVPGKVVKRYDPILKEWVRTKKEVSNG